MTRLALALALLAFPATAEPITLHGPCGGADQIVAVEEGAGVLLTYTNDMASTSSPCTQTLSVGDVTLHWQVYINVSGTNMERFEVRPPEGYAAIPEYLDVEDGLEGQILVVPMMF